jgi:glycosyltransferase involved in cell wall biosynthesis
MACAMISDVRPAQVTGTRSILHIVPSCVSRGAQVHARALVDLLDSPHERHTLVSLFSGETGIAVDATISGDGGATPASGFDPVTALRLHGYVKRTAPDVVVAHGGDPLKYVVGSLVGVPVVYHAIGTVTASVRSPLRRALWRVLLHRAEVVAAVSDDVAEECRRLLSVPAGKVRVVPNGRDAVRFRPRSEATGPRGGSPPVVIFVGRLTPGKRPGVFVDMARVLRERGAVFRALVVGDGPERSGLDVLAEASGVEMLGERADVPELMRDADLFVFPSLPEGEGMPGVLIEAGLSGLAVLATDVPGVKSVVEDGVTGLVVGTSDFAGLNERAFDLISDRKRLSAMGTAARARCESMFTIEVCASRWRDLLDDMDI